MDSVAPFANGLALVVLAALAKFPNVDTCVLVPVPNGVDVVADADRAPKPPPNGVACPNTGPLVVVLLDAALCNGFGSISSFVSSCGETSCTTVSSSKISSTNVIKSLLEGPSPPVARHIFG